MELGNQPLYDSKHCEASACVTTEANLCYDFKKFNVHKSHTTAASASMESSLEPKSSCPGEIMGLEFSFCNGRQENTVKSNGCGKVRLSFGNALELG